jgi:hypothetical protein
MYEFYEYPHTLQLEGMRSLVNVAYSSFYAGQTPTPTAMGAAGSVGSVIDLSASIHLQTIEDAAFADNPTHLIMVGPFPSLQYLGYGAFSGCSNPNNNITINCVDASFTRGKLPVGPFEDFEGSHHSAGEKCQCGAECWPTIPTTILSTIPTPSIHTPTVTTTTTTTTTSEGDTMGTTAANARTKTTASTTVATTSVSKSTAVDRVHSTPPAGAATTPSVDAGAASTTAAIGPPVGGAVSTTGATTAAAGATPSGDTDTDDSANWRDAAGSVHGAKVATALLVLSILGFVVGGGIWLRGNAAGTGNLPFDIGQGEDDEVLVLSEASIA